MLKIIRRIFGFKKNNIIDINDPSLRQYFIDHTVVLNMIAEDRKRMQQVYEIIRQRRSRESARSWEVSAVETDNDESECRDSTRAVVLVRGKAKTASIETKDQGSVLNHNRIVYESSEWILVKTCKTLE